MKEQMALLVKRKIHNGNTGKFETYIYSHYLGQVVDGRWKIKKSHAHPMDGRWRKINDPGQFAIVTGWDHDPFGVVTGRPHVRSYEVAKEVFVRTADPVSNITSFEVQDAMTSDLEEFLRFKQCKRIVLNADDVTIAWYEGFEFASWAEPSTGWPKKTPLEEVPQLVAQLKPQEIVVTATVNRLERWEEPSRPHEADRSPWPHYAFFNLHDNASDKQWFGDEEIIKRYNVESVESEEFHLKTALDRIQQEQEDD